jgi:hypothetical protein
VLLYDRLLPVHGPERPHEERRPDEGELQVEREAVVHVVVYPAAEQLPYGEGYHVEEEFEEGDYKLLLVTEVVGLLPKANVLKGIYSHDYVMHVFHRGKVAPMPRTVEALFSFAEHEGTAFLTIVEKKRLANFIANKLSEILFEKVGSIVEARIPPETLRAFHLKNPEDTKITFFDNVDIPNVNSCRFMDLT